MKRILRSGHREIEFSGRYHGFESMIMGGDKPKERPQVQPGGGGGGIAPPKKTVFKLQVVDDTTSKPVSGVALIITRPDGWKTSKTTDAKGEVQIPGVEPGDSFGVYCDPAEIGKGNVLDYVGVGAGPLGSQPLAGIEPTSAQAGLLIMHVNAHMVKTGEGLVSLATPLGLTWQQLTLFNWGTAVPTEVNVHLYEDVGCRKPKKDDDPVDPFANYSFSDEDVKFGSGMILLPSKFQQGAMGSEMLNIIRVRPIEKATFGVVKLAAPEFLAPGLPPDQEPFKLDYEINDPGGRITVAKLEIYDKDSTDKPAWSGELKKEDYTHGPHQKPWDGKITPTDKYADGYLNITNSPYKVRITVAGNGTASPKFQEAEFKIEAVELKLELGDKKTLKEVRDKTLYDSLEGALPAAGETKEVKLISNIFKRSSDEMNDNTAFTQYSTAWGDGPNIPIFAKVWLKNSLGTNVVAGAGLGGVKFLWDWEDVAEDTSTLHAKAKAFIDNAVDFDKAKTGPKGDNCHRERGGKRGPANVPSFRAAPKRVFPNQPGYNAAADFADGKFPFKVETCSTRKWASFSQAWSSGAGAGKTGAMFQPARMAGDAYKLTVYLADKLKDDKTPALDVIDDAPLPGTIKDSTGTFALWREAHLIKYVKKKASLPGFSVATFQTHYEMAKIRFIDKTGGASAMPADDYNSKIAAAVNGKEWYIKAAVDPATDQHAAGDSAVYFRAYGAYKTALKAAQGWDDDELNAWLAGAGATLNTAAKYHGLCKDWAKAIVTAACDGYLSADNGVNILQFTGLYNLETSPGGNQLNGFAADFPSASRNKCAFVQCAGAGNYGGDSNSMEQTITHEIGHHLFMPHAPFPATSVPGGAQADRHDDDWEFCMMGYNYAQERKFCGLCILRLRGWDATGLDKTAANNKRE